MTALRDQRSSPINRLRQLTSSIQHPSLSSQHRFEMQPIIGETDSGAIVDFVGAAARANRTNMVPTAEVRGRICGLLHSTVSAIPDEESQSGPVVGQFLVLNWGHHDDPRWQRYYDKLDSFKSLTKGWNGYAAPAPSHAAIKTARILIRTLRESDRTPSRLKPSVVGGVGFTFRRGERKVYVEVYNNGTVYALFSCSEDEMDVIAVPPTNRSFEILVEEIGAYIDD